jgi:hypothetical protein
MIPMARWFYNRPSEKCDESEIKVANKLRRLSKRWTIRWGFYYQDNKGIRREGDFLIFDPLHGILVLEVKGDRFRQFAPTGCVTGALSGLIHREDGIPADWRETLVKGAELAKLAGRFAEFCLQQSEFSEEQAPEV